MGLPLGMNKSVALRSRYDSARADAHVAIEPAEVGPEVGLTWRNSLTAQKVGAPPHFDEMKPEPGSTSRLPFRQPPPEARDQPERPQETGAVEEIETIGRGIAV